MSKIIIMDDSIDLLEVMKYFLEDKGYSIKICQNKKSLLSLINTFKPDLLILDVFLAGEDGRKICREIKHNKDTKHLCVLMFSASPRALQNFEEYGAEGSIEKPFGLNDILDKIEATLNICKDVSN